MSILKSFKQLHSLADKSFLLTNHLSKNFRPTSLVGLKPERLKYMEHEGGLTVKNQTTFVKMWGAESKKNICSQKR